MGVDLTGGAHWGYIGFHNYRYKLAKEIDIDLELMEGYGGDMSWDNISSPLKYFLNHSDCEGIISYKICSKIYPVLEYIVSQWEEDDYDRIQSELVIEGMKECVDNKKSFKFF